MNMLPLLRFPQFFPGQFGVEGSEVPLGLRSAGGNVYYLGKAVGEITPNDEGDGLDPLHPKATLASALAECVAGRGDVIIVLPGRYDFTATATVNKAGVKIVAWDYLRGAAAPTAIFDGNGVANILDIEANQVEIAGIAFENVENSTFSGIRVAVTGNRVGLDVHNCLFRAGKYGILLGVGANIPSDLWIHDNVFQLMHETADDAGIFVTNTEQGVIERNTFWSNLVAAVHGVDLADVSTPGLLIRENDFIFQQAGTGIRRGGATCDVSMHRNHFSGAGTPITVLADGGDHAVENYVASAGGGAVVDPTT